jgi:hypothetical protein
MYDVILLDNDAKMPDHGTYYVVAGNGIFIHKDTGLIKGLVPVESVSFLEDIHETQIVSKWVGPKIPHEVSYKVKRFFYKVFQKYGSEANTILFYNQQKNDWIVVVPDQVVSRGSVTYKRESLTHLPEFADFIPIGTIHSHADFNAFHSGTDDRDEETFDGIHITFGHNNNSGPITISASVVMNGIRTLIEPEEVLEGFDKCITDGPENYMTKPLEPDQIVQIENEVENWLDKVKG